MSKKLLSPKIIILFIFLIFMAMAGAFYMSYSTGYVGIYNFLFRANVVSYIPGGWLKINDVHQTQNISPELKGVLMGKDGGENLYSVLGTIKEPVQLPAGVMDPRLDELVILTLTVELATGQNIKLKINSHNTSIYWDANVVKQDDEEFMSSNFFTKDELPGYYKVDQGFRYFMVGDKVNIIWKSSAKPSQLLGKGGFLGRSILEVPPTAVLAKR